MKISTLGTGNMARAIAGRWAEAGHAVFFGSRDPAKARAVAAEIGFGAVGGGNDEAARFGDVVLHTVRRPPADFLRDPAALDGRIVVDVNNHDWPRPSGPTALERTYAAAVQAAHPQARVVKAFNTMATEVFGHEPEALREMGVSAFLVGDDPSAVDVVADLAAQLGLEPVRMGGLDQSWLLEAQADFIRTLIFADGGPLATVSTRVLPAPVAPRFGGRRPGAY